MNDYMLGVMLGGRLGTSGFYISPHVDVLTDDSMTIFSFSLWLSGALTRCSFTWISGVAMVIADESLSVGS